jgi:hypothetical protein
VVSGCKASTAVSLVDLRVRTVRDDS